VCPLLIGVTATAADEAGPELARPCIEVVFVPDTTGTLSGQIQAATGKIWAIAHRLI
jgi:hypothetical protein